MGGTYLLGGAVLLIVAGSLLFVWPETFQPAVLTVVAGGLVLGLVFFGLIFVLVAIEDLKSGAPASEGPKEEKKKRK
ncbi:hypothetical protein J4450_04580 [Candidatus Micrarchaeota archaeon]|nr:hypothetical protein [Candidatus Micrarchaeota archaeon]